MSETKSPEKTGEQIFVENADECLSIIEKRAQELEITGAGMIAFVPGTETTTWVSKMKVMGRITDGNLNFCGVIYSKAAEMAITLKDSGNESRKDIIGELGWQGGVIIKVKSGYLLGAFSGGSGEQDVESARKGLEWLAQKYQ
ncbi:MAG: hypothetical protein ACERKD_08900 [Prolixibacteraceae bacterium]